MLNNHRFYNTNDFVYLSFVLKNTGSLEQLHISGGLANTETNNIGYKGYGYRRDYQIPFNAFSGSALSNPVPTGSHYQRYIFKSQQNYFRPTQNGENGADVSLILKILVIIPQHQLIGKY